MPERLWKGHGLKHAVASCGFHKFMICDRLFYLFSLQVVNTVHEKESKIYFFAKYESFSLAQFSLAQFQLKCDYGIFLLSAY